MTQREALDLLERATSDLPFDLESVVASGVRRGRTRRRNRRIGTTVAVAALAGVVSLGVAQLPLGGPGGGETAIEPTIGPSQKVAPTPTVPVAPVLSVSAKDFPAVVAGLAGVTDVEGPLMGPGFGVADGPGQWIAHFRLDGMLTSLQVYRVSDDPRLACEDSFGSCRQVEGAWLGSRAGEPQDGVTMNSATAWRGDLEITALSYNAAEGKESPVLSERPQLSPEQLEAMVLDPVWFTPAASPGVAPTATAPPGP